MTNLVTKIHRIHNTLESAGLSHAFGGALALAWCTQRARGTIDIDVNVFIPVDEFKTALAALPTEIRATKKDIALLKRDGQARLWWDKTPIDVFLNNTNYHEELKSRVRWEMFAGEHIPFLSCFDLAVFKAFFNRTKDWADLEAMQAAGTLDIKRVQLTLARYLGVDDQRIEDLEKLTPH